MPSEKYSRFTGKIRYRPIERRTLTRVLTEHQRAVLSWERAWFQKRRPFDYLLSHCYTIWIKAQPGSTCRGCFEQGYFARMAGK